MPEIADAHGEVIASTSPTSASCNTKPPIMLVSSMNPTCYFPRLLSDSASRLYTAVVGPQRQRVYRPCVTGQYRQH